jgi:hypothetical protein
MNCVECVRGGRSSRWGVCARAMLSKGREEEGKQEGSLASATSAALRLTQHIALAHQHYTLQSTNLTKYEFRTKGTPIHQKVKYRTRNAVTDKYGRTEVQGCLLWRHWCFPAAGLLPSWTKMYCLLNVLPRLPYTPLLLQGASM